MAFCQNVNGFSWTVVNPNISAIFFQSSFDEDMTIFMPIIRFERP